MWLDKGRQMRRHGIEHESPWAKLFAQGAMTTIVYDRQNLLAEPEESRGGSQGPQIRRELFRTPPARLPRLGRGC